jgi:hypothetical protein
MIGSILPVPRQSGHFRGSGGTGGLFSAAGLSGKMVMIVISFLPAWDAAKQAQVGIISLCRLRFLFHRLNVVLIVPLDHKLQMSGHAAIISRGQPAKFLLDSGFDLYGCELGLGLIGH